MTIIISAAGKGQRFKDKGINCPKYEIMINGHSMFYWSLSSLERWFDDSKFIFVFNINDFNEHFFEYEIEKLGIKNWEVIFLDKYTNGQATSVYQACNKHIDNNESILIYNIDTYISPLAIATIDSVWFSYNGLIPYSKLEGNQWSFIKQSENSYKIIKTSEKKRISDMASVGIYYFKKWLYFKTAYEKAKIDKSFIKKYKEFYICPLYNYLIEYGLDIVSCPILKDDIVCLGTPKDLWNAKNILR